MKTLTLHVKREWFHLMQQFKKHVEYRKLTPYWCQRIIGEDFDCVEICLGYPKKKDKGRRLLFKYEGYCVKVISHPHWNWEDTDVIAIKLGKIYTQKKGRS